MGMVIEPGRSGVCSGAERDVGATGNRGIRTLPNPGMSMMIDKAGLLARSNDGLVDHQGLSRLPRYERVASWLWLDLNLQRRVRVGLAPTSLLVPLGSLVTARQLNTWARACQPRTGMSFRAQRMCGKLDPRRKGEGLLRSIVMKDLAQVRSRRSPRSITALWIDPRLSARVKLRRAIEHDRRRCGDAA